MQINNDQSENNNILRNVVSLISIFGILLYFTGWIYRWYYFNFFELDVNSLNLPFESFFIEPIKVFLGDINNFILSIATTFMTFYTIKISLWLINQSKFYSSKKYLEKIHNFYLFKPLFHFLEAFPKALRTEIIIIGWILTALFFLARYQGYVDAHNDLVNDTSKRPTITLVANKDNLAVGAIPSDILERDSKSLENSRIIGKHKFLYDIWENPLNKINRTQPTESIIWRLLIKTDNWIYIYKGLGSKKEDGYNRPVLLAINARQAQVQMLILHVDDPDSNY